MIFLLPYIAPFDLGLLLQVLVAAVAAVAVLLILYWPKLTGLLRRGREQNQD